MAVIIVVLTVLLMPIAHLPPLRHRLPLLHRLLLQPAPNHGADAAPALTADTNGMSVRTVPGSACRPRGANGAATLAEIVNREAEPPPIHRDTEIRAPLRRIPAVKPILVRSSATVPVVPARLLIPRDTEIPVLPLLTHAA